jgi:hypothetical protein
MNLIQAVHLNDKGAAVANLHAGLLFLVRNQPGISDNDRRILEQGIASELRDQVYRKGTMGLVALFQEQLTSRFQLVVNGDVDQATADALNKILAELGSTGVDPDKATFYDVAGTVSSPDSAGVGGLRVQIVDKNIGPDVALGEATTDERGLYHLRFSAATFTGGKKQPDLQARVFAARTFLAASDIRYNATNSETLDVRLPANATALPSEYETLIRAIAARYTGPLAALQKETGERQDFAYLAAKTGWTPGAIELAAAADQFSKQPGVAAIQASFYYALFRAGLPAKAETLYQTNADTVGRILREAGEQRVIPKVSEPDITATVKVFQAIGVAGTLNSRVPGAVSSFKEMAQISLGNDAQLQQKFAELHTRLQDDPPKFWAAVKQAFGEVTTNSLKLDGQLLHLTGNNAPLIAGLRTAETTPLSSAVDLVGAGYYDPEKWLSLIGTAIPEQIPGASAAEKRTNYAEVLAAQVRLSYPTAVVAEMVRSGDLPTANAEVRDGVHAFLGSQDGKFEIGMQPIEQYLTTNNLGSAVSAPVKEQLKAMQRVYQLTPNNEAMGVLLKNDLHSAYEIVKRYDEAEFVRSFGGELGEDVARVTYAKVEQVNNAVFNIAASYFKARNEIVLGYNQETPVIAPNPPPPGANIIATATLEQLFGSMDYCACEHCRSILSPAAYLVNLLQFLDRQTGAAKKPLDVLLERRPDIQYLLLTCENTNIPLPYIDLVNETLEYFVAHPPSLKGYEGHDTGDSVAAAELLATPQFVDDAAYAALKTELFPPPLPFHQPLETLRRYFDKFEVPLQVAMERLRVNDTPDGWRDILMEQLKFSRVEYDLLTNSKLTLKSEPTLQQLYGFASDMKIGDAVSNLSGVKAFARRLGLTFDEVLELLKTNFINPNLALVPRLQRLGVSFATLKAFKENPIPAPDFGAADPAQYGGDIKTWMTDNYARIMGLITIVNPNDSNDLCNFDDLQFRYSNPDDKLLRVIDFVRILRFIRLWRKLGWSIEQTDKAITALYPATELPTGTDDAADLTRLDDGFLKLLPRLGIVAQLMSALALNPKRDLVPLLACWAPIDSHGDNSLYRQMFLGSSPAQQDAAFADNGYGDYLRNSERLVDHAETLRAAFQLTGDEMSRIIATFRFRATTPLNLTTISAVYRWGWLARKLRLSVAELLLLVRFTDLDPFAAPDPVNPPVVRLVGFVAALRAASLKPVEALYLMWNQDVSGKSAPDAAQITAFARTLRAGFAQIESEFALVDDPNGEIARARMSLVYGADATDYFFGLIDDTLVLDAAYSQAQSNLDPAISAVAPGRIAYDHFRKRLIHTGVLSAAKRDEFEGALEHLTWGPEATLGDRKAFAIAYVKAIDALFAQSQAFLDRFFDRFPELATPYGDYIGSNDPPETKRTALLATLLSDLKRRRKLNDALAALSAATRVDSAFARAVMDDVAVLHNAAADEPALADLTAMESAGLSAHISSSDMMAAVANVEGSAAPSQAPSSIRDNTLSAIHLPPGPRSGTWSGYLEAPETGLFNIAIDTEGAGVTLTLDEANVALTASGNTWSNTDAIALTAGTLLPVTLSVATVKGEPTVRWETKGRGWEAIPARYLYGSDLMDRLRVTYVRFLKLASLAAALKLTANEMAHFAADPDYQVGGQSWPNALAVFGEPDRPTWQKLRDVLAALLDFSRIKVALAPGDERLLSVLQNPGATLASGDSLLLTLTGWSGGSLDALLARFTPAGKGRKELTHFETFRRVYDAYALVTALGISAAALLTATTNEPGPDTVRALLSALRARYREADWRDVLKPINDEMRGLQRDALVASILQKMGEVALTKHIDTPDKLYEYFLMDVQMEPCMLTSRIRHALSSVQLFVDRCLMNLEQPRVAPAAINARQWEWMKRYRMWEANRKVFLWPENWLEPELRDNQSPMFKEAMSELLQSDITEDSAAAALLAYLSKLEEIAKLEACSICYDEGKSAAIADDVTHVVGRTSGAHRRYYYRRREGGYWTPWEEVKLDIEDNPVKLVRWKDRLFLFWLKIIQATSLDTSTVTEPKSTNTPVSGRDLAQMKAETRNTAQNTEVTVTAALCWSEYYNGKWQPTKTSDVNNPTVLGAARPGAFDRSTLSMLVVEATGDVLRLRINRPSNSLDEFLAGDFVMYNTHSVPVRKEDPTFPKTTVTRDKLPQFRYLGTSGETFSIGYAKSPGELFTPTTKIRPVLKNPIGDGTIDDSTIDPWNPLARPWGEPFFYQDGRHVFYVSTREETVRIGDVFTFGMARAAWWGPVVVEPSGPITGSNTA